MHTHRYKQNEIKDRGGRGHNVVPNLHNEECTIDYP